MAPALDLVLAVGDRVSRVVEREDLGYIPPTGSIEPPSGKRVTAGSAGAAAAE